MRHVCHAGNDEFVVLRGEEEGGRERGKEGRERVRDER